MPKIEFTKMQGIGNDYIYINCFVQSVPNPEELARIMSPRRFSVGADGVILICPSSVADAKMRMFNLDGSEGKMCGNGVRCVGKYLYDNNIAKKDIITVETLSGIKTLKVESENGAAKSLTVDMGKPVFTAKKIPIVAEGATVINKPFLVGGKQYNITAVSMGNPHAVVFCENTEDLELEKIGPEFENHQNFPEGVNTEFVRVIDENQLEMRVWERGSGETLACGTGACAVAVASVVNGYCQKDKEITVNLKGGKLYITYQKDERVLMRGGAETIYTGVFEY